MKTHFKLFCLLLISSAFTHAENLCIELITNNNARTSSHHVMVLEQGDKIQQASDTFFSVTGGMAFVTKKIRDGKAEDFAAQFEPLSGLATVKDGKVNLNLTQINFARGMLAKLSVTQTFNTNTEFFQALLEIDGETITVQECIAILTMGKGNCHSTQRPASAQIVACDQWIK